MLDDTDLTSGQLPDCLSDDRPCAALGCFCDRVVAACDLARHVTGSVPELHGTLAPDACPLDRACTVHWQVRNGALHLTRGGRALHTIHLRLQ